MTIRSPRATLVLCPACNGMGGFDRGEAAFDVCDRCAGEGRVHVRLCTADTAAGPCPEPLIRAWMRSDEPKRTGWACLSGHRWERTYHDGRARWERAADHVAGQVA